MRSISLWFIVVVFLHPDPAFAETVRAGDVVFVSRSISVASAAVATGDFDGDGHADLVAAGEPSLTVFYGDGQGAFPRSGRVPGGEQPVDFAVADLDGNRTPDIAVANHEQDYVTLLLSDGRGGFHPAPDSPLRIDVRPHPHAVRAGDLDADGHIDLVVDHREAEAVVVLRGLGGGRFDSPGTVVDVGGDPYRGMALGDIDGDGDLDLVTPNPASVGILLNRGGEGISFSVIPSIAADAPFAVALGEFNGDGRLDLLVASDQGSPRVDRFHGRGDGSFDVAPSSPLRLAPGGKNVVVGDFDGDGYDDAAVSSWASPEVMLMFGGTGAARTGFIPGGDHPWGLAVADFNEDGMDDLVVGDDGAQRAFLFLSAPQ